MNKDCPNCKMTFVTTNKNMQYCSASCRSGAWKKGPGKAYTLWHSREWHKAKARSTWKPRLCVWCSTEYLPLLSKKGQQRYCSKKCNIAVCGRVSRQNARMKKYMTTNGRGSEYRPLKVSEWLEILALHNRRCAQCGSDVRIEMDHKIPLNQGGTHDVSNIRVLCHDCNDSIYQQQRRSKALKPKTL